MRAIDKIFIHSTATPEGRSVTTAEICKWHRARGFNKIGYHYVIHLDGTVEPARDMNTAGAHVAGHNTGSIGIAYVGGTDATGKAKDTRTPAQRRALDELLCELRAQFPGATVHGHNEFGATACPSFNVQTQL